MSEVYTITIEAERFETFADKVVQRGVYKRQSSCPGHYGDVTLQIEPFEMASNIIIVENLSDENQIPKEFVGGIVKGIEAAAYEGGINGYPIARLKIFIIDGKYHEVDSRSLSFTQAAKLAFKQAVEMVGTAIISSKE